jgi:hypothetical protein
MRQTNGENEMFNDYSDITIMVGGLVGYSAVVSNNLHVTVLRQTEKAVLVEADNKQTLWLPKSAWILDCLS